GRHPWRGRGYSRLGRAGGGRVARAGVWARLCRPAWRVAPSRSMQSNVRSVCRYATHADVICSGPGYHLGTLVYRLLKDELLGRSVSRVNPKWDSRFRWETDAPGIGL